MTALSPRRPRRKGFVGGVMTIAESVLAMSTGVAVSATFAACEERQVVAAPGHERPTAPASTTADDDLALTLPGAQTLSGAEAEGLDSATEPARPRPTGSELRVIFDASLSMAGFWHASVTSHRLNEFLAQVRSEAMEAHNKARAGKQTAESLVARDLAVGRWPKPRRRGKEAQLEPTPCLDGGAMCPTRQECCLPSVDDGERVPDQATGADGFACRTPSQCGIAKRLPVGNVNNAAVFTGTASTATAGLGLAFAPQVHTAIYVTDGLDTPADVGLAPCAVDSPPKAPLLAQMLQREFDARGPDGWAAWLMVARFPFYGRVFLECGQATPAMRAALGARLREQKGKELSYITQHVELQPVMMVVLTRGDRAFAADLDDRLRSVQAELAAPGGEPAQTGVASSVSIVRLWPPAGACPCPTPKVEAAVADGRMIREIPVVGSDAESSVPVTMAFQHQRLAATVRVSCADQAQPDDRALFYYAPGGADVVLEGAGVRGCAAPATDPAKVFTVAASSQPGAQTTKGASPEAMAACQQALAQLGASAAAKTVLSWPTTAGWSTGALIRVAGFRSPARSADAVARLGLRGRCEPRMDGQVLKRLRVHDGDRWTAEQSTRGVPNFGAMVDEIEAFGKGMAAQPDARAAWHRVIHVRGR